MHVLVPCEARVEELLTSATRCRSEGAMAQLDHSEEQKEALLRHDSTRSAIGLLGSSRNFNAMIRDGPWTLNVGLELGVLRAIIKYIFVSCQL